MTSRNMSRKSEGIITIGTLVLAKMHVTHSSISIKLTKRIAVGFADGLAHLKLPERCNIILSIYLEQMEAVLVKMTPAMRSTRIRNQRVSP